jgi:hypothetical protein
VPSSGIHDIRGRKEGLEPGVGFSTQPTSGEQDFDLFVGELGRLSGELELALRNEVLELETVSSEFFGVVDLGFSRNILAGLEGNDEGLLLGVLFFQKLESLYDVRHFSVG